MNVVYSQGVSVCIVVIVIEGSVIVGSLKEGGIVSNCILLSSLQVIVPVCPG